jgi:hypothetical protein
MNNQMEAVKKAGRVMCLIVILSAARFAFAGEQLFGFSYPTDTLPKGKWEFEQSYIGKIGKVRGSYINSLFRTELEYGVTDNFQTAIYLNTRHVHASKNNRDETTGGENVPDDANPDNPYNEYTFDSVAFESIYRLLSPYKDPIGLAIYLEPAFGVNEYELEPKILLQKNFLEDKLVTVINIAWEFEWAREKESDGTFDPEWEHEMVWTNTAGVSYQVANNWWTGVEFKNANKFGQFRLRGMENNAYFLGPNVHYGNPNFWATGAVLFQLPLARGLSDDQRDEIAHGKLFGHEFEAIEVSVKCGFPF